MILLALCLIIFVFILPKNSPGPSRSFLSFGDNNLSWRTERNNYGLEYGYNSPYSKNISISTGNASYEYQPKDEYIMIENRGEENININGWKLKNSKDSKTYEVSGNLKNFNADIAYIPKAVSLFTGTGYNLFSDIVLKSGDEAIVSSGSIGQNIPYKITSFKENKCSGYLENLPEYEFNPPIQSNCPVPTREPGFDSLDGKCKDFIENFSSCHTPEYDGLDIDGEKCRGCVDGEDGLSNACVAFIKSHYSYLGCVNNHQNDKDFNLRGWRIFLDRDWEMWDEEDETIFLYDADGRLVNTNSY